MGALLNDGRDPKHESIVDDRGHDAAQHPLFHGHPHLREFVCGGTAAAINIVVTFPPNKVMFRQQVLYAVLLMLDSV